MTNAQAREYITRDSVMKLLSDEEIARISSAESKAAMKPGDEYVDLDAPSGGVHRCIQDEVCSNTALPRRSVNAATWASIVRLVAPSSPRDTEPMITANPK